MKMNQAVSAILHILSLMVLLGISGGANALCVKPDGSLDDPSMSPGSIAMDMVPQCEDSAPAAENVQSPTVATEQNSGVKKEAGKELRELVSAD